MTISWVVNSIEWSHDLNKTNHWLLSRCMTFIVVPIETVAVIAQLSRLIIFDCVAKSSLHVLGGFGLSSRLKPFDDRLKPYKTIWKIVALSGGLLSSCVLAWSSPEWNYNAHQVFGLGKK